MVAGIVLFALGLQRPSHTPVRGSALCLLWASPAAPRCTCSGMSRSCSGQLVEFSGGGPFGAVALLAFTPAAISLPALAALALVSIVCSSVVGYEVIHHREARLRIRPGVGG